MKTLIFRNKQFLLYCVIGASGTGLDLLVYAWLVKGLHINYQTANALSYASGTLLSFVLNTHFNFKTRDFLAMRLLSYFTVGFLGWSASAGILWWLIQRHHCNEIVAKLLTLGVCVLLQYNLNRWFSFRSFKSQINA